MATTPPYRLGKDLSVITIQRLSVSASGLFSNLGSPTSIQALITRLGHETRREMENIQPVTSQRMNMVPISTGNGVQISEIKLANAASAMNTVLATCQYVLISWTEGNESFAGYFSVGAMTEGGVNGRGQQVITVAFEPCDPGQAQVAYVAA